MHSIHPKENPYYEKWGPGRPSKEKIERRRLSREWFKEDMRLHPEKYAAIIHLMNGSYNISKNMRIEDGKIFIKFTPRYKSK